MTAPVVVFPDTVAAVIGHLRDELTTRGQAMPVRNQVPNPRPTPFVLVRRLGGARRDLIVDQPLLGVECWAATEHQAHDLAQLCRALINSLPGRTVGGVTVYRVDELGGPAELPDPLSDQPRYVFTSAVAVRGDEEV